MTATGAVRDEGPELSPALSSIAEDVEGAVPEPSLRLNLAQYILSPSRIRVFFLGLPFDEEAETGVGSSVIVKASCLRGDLALLYCFSLSDNISSSAEEYRRFSANEGLMLEPVPLTREVLERKGMSLAVRQIEADLAEKEQLVADTYVGDQRLFATFRR